MSKKIQSESKLKKLNNKAKKNEKMLKVDNPNLRHLQQKAFKKCSININNPLMTLKARQLKLR